MMDDQQSPDETQPTVSTGVPGLDRMLDGGLPKQRAVLLTGGPGTGKTTLAMHFLQEGLEHGENCLYISTEQTPAELHDTFAPFESIDLLDSNLTVTSIHATRGQTIEEGDTELTLQTLEGDTAFSVGMADENGVMGQRFSAPFTNQYIQQTLEEYAPCDRVVFDSVSGLQAMTNDSDIFRRAVLDLIRFFTDEFSATSIFTAEESTRSPLDPDADVNSNTLQFNTHGVLRVWREAINETDHRFIEVVKMRGADHETRPFEFEFDTSGIRIRPTLRTTPDALVDHDFLSTGIPGLDGLCGGGWIEGSTGLLEHDGRAQVDTLITSMATEALRHDAALVLIPPANMTPSRLDTLLADRLGSLEELLERDQLFVFDLVGAWTEFETQTEHPDNIFSLGISDSLIGNVVENLKPWIMTKAKRISKTINVNRGDRQAFGIFYTESLLQKLSPDDIRKMNYWAKQHLFREEDTMLFVQNPAVMDDQLAEFYVYDAKQMLKTWQHENGLQYIQLEKSPTGAPGSTQLLDYIADPPYVQVQSPNRPRNH